VVFLHPGASDGLTVGTTALGFPGYRVELRSPWERGFRFKSLAGFLFYFPSTLRQLLTILGRERIDIVNIHYAIPSFGCFGVLRLITRKRLVVSLHGSDLVPIEPEQRGLHTGVRYLLRSAHSIVVPSQGFRKELVQQLPEFAPRVQVIHNGVRFDSSTEGPIPRAPDVKRPYLLCVAAHNRKKGIDVLLKAFVKVRGERPDLRLRLAGEGPLTPSLVKMAESLELTDSVEFLGAQSQAEIAHLLRGCEVFVLPSRAESFGISALEALLMRRPVVATAVGGLPEVIVPGKSGILVPPDDPDRLAEAILRVLGDSDLRESLAKSGAAHARAHFTREIMGTSYEQLFSRLLDNPPKSTSVSKGLVC